MHPGTNWRTIGLFLLLAIGWPWLVAPLLAVLGLLLLPMLGNVGHLAGVGQLDVHGAAIVENLRRLNPELPTTAIKLTPDGLLIPLFIGGAL
jgi:hypothetical protein